MIIVVVGPTGVGKTKMSIELAKKYNGIVLNADATQIYKELDIGSAKVREDEKEGIDHYLFDIKNPNQEYSVSDYQIDARKILDSNKDKNIIIVGGTGLYISALLYDYEFNKMSDIDLSNYTNDELYEMCKKKDKNVDIHPNNRVRLENFIKRENISNNGNKMLYDAKIIGLTTPRDNLYNIIDKRVDKMIEEGLLEEVSNLYNKYPDSKILKRAIGYKELIEYIDGNIGLEEAKNLIKKNTRHYAKRQYTWFNNKMNVTWFNTNYDNFSNTVNEVIEYIDNL